MAKQGASIIAGKYLNLYRTPIIFLFIMPLRKILLIFFCEKDLFDFAMISDNNALKKHAIFKTKCYFCILITDFNV